MTSVAAAPVAAAPVRNRAEVTIARRAFRQLRTGAIICAVVFGGTAASSALAYVQTFPDEASRQQIAATTSADVGLRVLLGPIAGIDTVGGYTVYKGFVFLTTIGAVWALLAATRVLRGEEDNGRWELMLAGTTRPGRATAATLSALALAVAIIFVGTTALVAAAGRNPDVGFDLGGSIVYGASLALVPAVFAAVGAVTSQLGSVRRVATGLGIGVLAACFALRMVADASPGTAWVRWLTPFGWSELIEPFTADDLRPLIPAVLVTVLLGAAAVVLSARRDVGSGLVASDDVAGPRPFGLGSALGLTVRLEWPVIVAWWAGLLATGLLLGIVAKMTTESIPESMQSVFEKLGVHVVAGDQYQGLFFREFLGVCFLMIGAVVALVPAVHIGAAADEETTGRLVNVLGGPTRRTTWFAGRLAVAAIATLLGALVAGFGLWLGARSQGLDADLVSLTGASLNVVPVALVALGIGAVVLALRPSFASAAVYLVVAWSLIVDILASLTTGTEWLGTTSLFNYLALAPSEPVDAATIVGTVAVAAVLLAVAVVGFHRRDLELG